MSGDRVDAHIGMTVVPILHATFEFAVRNLPELLRSPAECQYGRLPQLRFPGSVFQHGLVIRCVGHAHHDPVDVRRWLVHFERMTATGQCAFSASSVAVEPKIELA